MVAVILPILYVLIILSPLALIFLTGPITDHEHIYELGKAFAMMGFAIVGMQFILSSRRKWIERSYGVSDPKQRRNPQTPTEIDGVTYREDLTITTFFS